MNTSGAVLDGPCRRLRLSLANRPFAFASIDNTSPRARLVSSTTIACWGTSLAVHGSPITSST